MEKQPANLIKPMALVTSLFYFGIPAASILFVVYVLMPYLANNAIPIFTNYLLFYATLPMLGLIAASIIAYRHEGNPMSWEAFKARFRLKPMQGMDWVWTIHLTLFMVLSAGLLSFSAGWLVTREVFKLPQYWPAELNPAAQNAAGAGNLPTTFLELPLANNGWIVIAVLLSLVIATFGEEFWWRGYILPRQELLHGKWTWIVHGLMWIAFHLFAPWNLITILPGSLALSFVAQKRKNTWTAIIAHGTANGLLVLVVIVLGVFG